MTVDRFVEILKEEQERYRPFYADEGQQTGTNDSNAEWYAGAGWYYWEECRDGLAGGYVGPFETQYDAMVEYRRRAGV